MTLKSTRLTEEDAVGLSVIREVDPFRVTLLPLAGGVAKLCKRPIFISETKIAATPDGLKNLFNCTPAKAYLQYMIRPSCLLPDRLHKMKM